MKFSCEKALLLAAVSVTSRAVATKSSIPAMEGILIEADSRLRLTGYDLSKGIQATVPAEIIEPGALVLPARRFGDIIRSLPDDIVVFSSQDYKVNLQCGMSEFNLMATDPEEFPELPTVEQQNSITLKQSVLRAMISQTLFAVSDNESRPILTGSLFEVNQKELTVVSVDGYRLALRREEVDQVDGEDSFSFVVPGNALSEVEKICTSDDPVTVSPGARHILFQTGDTLLICRRLEGEFLAYRNTIPKNNPIQVECGSRELLTSISRVSTIISEKLKSPLRCIFGDGMVTIMTKTGEGDGKDNCPIVGDGQNLEIGFNNKFLMDALKAAPADRLKLNMSSGVAPCVIVPADGEENFLYMVLPLRLRAGE